VAHQPDSDPGSVPSWVSGQVNHQMEPGGADQHTATSSPRMVGSWKRTTQFSEGARGRHKDAPESDDPECRVSATVYLVSCPVRGNREGTIIQQLTPWVGVENAATLGCFASEDRSKPCEQARALFDAACLHGRSATANAAAIGSGRDRAAQFRKRLMFLSQEPGQDCLKGSTVFAKKLKSGLEPPALINCSPLPPFHDKKASHGLSAKRLSPGHRGTQPGELVGARPTLPGWA